MKSIEKSVILQIKDVSIAYDREKYFAVENVSFDICEGEYVCLIGSNGSGKSTLMKGIVGVIPTSKGKVEKILDEQSWAYMGQVNMIDKGFPATVEEVVLSGTQKKSKRLPFYSKQDKKTAYEAMALFEITNLAKKRIGNLSGGQQQRVLLARAFCRNPKLLILDEPCAGLDPVITEEFYGIIGRLNKEKGVTILMASHDMAQVASFATRVIVMDHQTKVFDGTTDEWRDKNHA